MTKSASKRFHKKTELQIYREVADAAFRLLQRYPPPGLHVPYMVFCSLCGGTEKLPEYFDSLTFGPFAELEPIE